VITEHLMRPGSGSVLLRPDAPLSMTQAIFDLVNEDTAAGVGAHIVITPTRVRPDEIGDDAVLATASYVGRIVKRPSRLALQFVGLGSWLSTYLDTEETRTSGTPANWLADLLRNDLSAGTASGTGTVTKTFPAYVTTAREALDAVCGIGGWEYRINPDFTVDTHDEGSLFVSPPTVVVTRKAEGLDGEFRGVDGGMIDQAIDVSQVVSKVVALAAGAGTTIAVGSATDTPNLNAPLGSAPTLVSVVSAPGEESGNASTLATNVLAQQGQQRAVSVSTRTHHLPRHVRPGDEVYVYDLAGGIYDTSNQIQFRGELLTPALVRLLSYTWPIESGLGVYVRSNEASPTYIDVTNYVTWERSETRWTVGDWSPPSYGRINRTDPEVETRVSDSRWEFVSSGASAATNWTIDSLNARVSHNMLQFRLIATRTTSAITWPTTGDIANTLVATLPASLRGDITLNQNVGSGISGRLAAGFYQASTGELYLSAVGGVIDVAIGEKITLGGLLLINE